MTRQPLPLLGVEEHRQIHSVRPPCDRRIPAEGKEKAYANGLTLAVSYMDHDGHPVNASTLQQGTNFTAVVTIANPSPRGYSHLVLTEVFPADGRY